MRHFLKRFPNLPRAAAFLLALAVLTAALGQIALRLDRSANPLYNISTSCLFDEAENSIDVLAIGTSSVYSAVEPTRWWDSLGCTGYAWGRPAQRIYDTYTDLRKIYRVQSPGVVFLELGNLYRDRTDAQNLDSLVKTHLAELAPLVAYHRNLNPSKWGNWNADIHSLSKGFLLRRGVKAMDSSDDYMRPDDTVEEPNFLSRAELIRCIRLCQEKGSTPVLLSVPDSSMCSMARHNAIEAIARECGVTFLDLNVKLAGTLDWSRDTADGGVHLNYRGAAKVTDYLGQWLRQNAALSDHRGDGAYDAWAEDCRKFDAGLAAAGAAI